MNYKTQIHKRKIYLSPRPKEDVENGIMVVLNKPLPGQKRPFIFCDIESGKKEYPLMELPDGYWVLGAVAIKDDKIKTKVMGDARDN